MGKVENPSLIYHFYQRFANDDVFGLAAQLAYFFLLSLFPLLIFLVSLVPYLPISEADILNVIRDFAPGQTMQLIESNLHELMEHHSGQLLTFGVIATLWSASNGINAIVKGFNHAYDVKETRPFWQARGMAIVLTVAMVFVFIVALLLPVFGKQIGLYIAAHFNNSWEFLEVWGTLRWVISTVIIFIVFLGLYIIAPNKKVMLADAIPGAVFATIGFAVVSLAFSFYVDNFGNYAHMYGSLGGIIVLLIWFYLTSFVIIIGGEINAYMALVRKR
ncbi:MAG TPA: YihY/virulence factor BrkB family protein [Bacillus sp. (in: firmicutes)]|uniref:YihY/virulence factor BrkB family protein n=1 Tax=Bacillus litorisediminis TaxID=2922713 RepID=UPI001FAB3FCC|nr:YihY/virulence factor BrkB family protein [Bacillus litorisediminis]HWO74600.1 YihY/virulence factor BrkB family protein [Bacillus sp. (in: firmicutes)]